MNLRKPDNEYQHQHQPSFQYANQPTPQHHNHHQQQPQQQPQQHYQPGYQPQPQQQPNQYYPTNTFYNPMEHGVNNLLKDPVASMAVRYGTTLADQGKDYVAQNVDRWFSISKLRFYFAVDTSYVRKKLMVILFPFFNKDWTVKYDQSNEAVPPKLDMNAPDLYIPVMAFITYVLMVGILLGTQSKFTTEQLGMNTTFALCWFIIEVFIIFIMLQILGIKSALKTFDIMAFCGYKYFGIIVCLASFLVLATNIYWMVFLYMCIAITYFMVRNLKLVILTNQDEPADNSHSMYQPQQQHMHHNSLGNKRRTYVLLFISILQPFFMWLLTRHLVY